MEESVSIFVSILIAAEPRTKACLGITKGVSSPMGDLL